MCNWDRIIRQIVAVTTLTVGASASAAQFDVKGSDTLYDVMTDAISAYRTELSPADFVHYLGTGSGNGEKAMATHAATPFQRIAPMSRNLTSSAIATCETGTTTSRPSTGGVGAANCRAEPKNVLGLDAAVAVEGRGTFTTCGNLPLGTDPVDPTIAADNNWLQLILGGKGGTGLWTDCASPDRVNAIQQLLNCNVGLGQFSHWYRRDDSSGTSDTMREKLKIARFCNGEGKPAAGAISANLQNPDYDPIRTDCPAGVSGSKKQVRCTVTDLTSANYLKDCSSKRCSGNSAFGCFADADCAALSAGTCTVGLDPSTPGCTAGFLVSLSEPDNTTVTDITMTIAARVLADSSAVGYAGRESVRRAPVSGSPAIGPTVNTNTPSNNNIRQDKYLLSRRLWLQDTVNQNDAEIPICSGNGPGCDNTNVSGRDAAEALFFHWATDGLPLVSAKSGRENMDPILIKWGFIACTDDFSQPSGDGNLCSKGYGASGFPAGAGAPTKCTPNSVTGTAWAVTDCATGTSCCSDGLLCETASHPAGSATAKACPAPAPRPPGAACRFDSECASSSCDSFGTNTTGTCL